MPVGMRDQRCPLHTEPLLPGHEEYSHMALYARQSRVVDVGIHKILAVDVGVLGPEWKRSQEEQKKTMWQFGGSQQEKAPVRKKQTHDRRRYEDSEHLSNR